MKFTKWINGKMAFLAVACTLGLAACSTTKEETANTEPNTPESTEVVHTESPDMATERPITLGASSSGRSR